MEHCRLSRHDGGVALAGVVLLRSVESAWRIDYEVRSDADWRTRSVEVRPDAGGSERTLSLVVDARGRWTAGGQPRPELDGCVDVDLAFSPSTNTLPIQRLGLDIGQSATLDAAWVEFPSLAVRRVPQRYTRLDAGTFRYENLPTGFTADLTVDEQALVVAYPPGWERVSAPLGSHPLFCDAPSPELGEAASLYSSLIGRWDVDIVDYASDGSATATRGEWHFGWALEGRAVQDVLIAPPRPQRPGLPPPRRGTRYGTTVRFYDRGRQAWRIVWINPVSGDVNSLVARRRGAAIVHEGVDDDGTLMRWMFVEILRDRFRWIGEASNDAGVSWQKRAEFFGRRVSFAPLR